jgi:hypothetical protein
MIPAIIPTILCAVPGSTTCARISPAASWVPGSEVFGSHHPSQEKCNRDHDRDQNSDPDQSDFDFHFSIKL